MTTLYVREPGALVRRTGRRLLVEKDGRVLQAVRLREVARVALMGQVTLTAPAAHALLEAGVEVALLTRGGALAGYLSPPRPKNVFLRRTQFLRHEDAGFRLSVGKAIVRGKVRNARQAVTRHHRNHPAAGLAEAARKLERRRERIDTASSLEQLMGLEGDAAKEYFAAFGSMVRAEFPFSGRNRRPPRDPVNALLSFGYTLLTTELTGALAAEGLDPHVGLLHELDYGRPSLALDVLEEFRQPVADRLALSLVNREVLRHEHFETTADGAVLLNDPGRRIFMEGYYRTLETPFRERGAPADTTLREVMRRQCGRMRETIEAGTEYVPYAAR